MEDNTITPNYQLIKFEDEERQRPLYIKGKVPTICPLCNSKIFPIQLYSKYSLDNKTVSTLYFCNGCKNVFIAKYKFESVNDINNIFDFYELTPKNYVRKIFDEKIEKFFSTFCDIYNQAVAAESYELKDIAGMAYRKSLEFLIKDYCILLNT